MADVARAKRNLERLMADGYDDPDEEIFLELCGVLLRHGVGGERATRILQRMISGVKPVVSDSVQ